MKLYTIDTGLFKLDGGAMFGVVPQALWKKLNPPDEKNMCTWAMRCLLIEDGHRLILTDTGIGDKQDEKFRGHFYLHGDDTLEGSLRKHGFSSDEITDVFLTHLHFDHCGGTVKREGEKLLPSFKNAKVWSNEKHWNWAVNPNPRERASFLKENILPIQENGQLNFIEEGGSFNHPDFDVIFVDGHTEKQMLPVIRHKGKTIVYCADLIPSKFHLGLPYVMAYDVRPLETLKEKEALLKKALKENYILYFEHDPETECCTVKEDHRGRIVLDQSFSLSEAFS